MDGRWLWGLLWVSLVVNLAGAILAGWALWEWRRAVASERLADVGLSLRTVSFRLAQLEGRTKEISGRARAIEGLLAPESFVQAAELEELLARAAARAAVAASPQAARGESPRDTVPLCGSPVSDSELWGPAPPAWVDAPAIESTSRESHATPVSGTPLVRQA